MKSTKTLLVIIVPVVACCLAMGSPGLADVGDEAEELVEVEDLVLEDFDEAMNEIPVEEEMPAEEAMEDFPIEGSPEPDMVETILFEESGELEPAEETVVEEMIEAVPPEPVAMEEAPLIEEPLAAEEPAPAPMPIAEDVDFSVAEIEAVETEDDSREDVFDNSGEIIALAMKLKDTETQLAVARKEAEELRERATRVGELEQAVAVTALDLARAREEIDTLRVMAAKATEFAASEQEKAQALRQAPQTSPDHDLARAQTENDKLKDLVRRIWKANQRERLNMHYNMAGAYRAGGLYKRAEREYMRALALSPNDAGVHFNLAILYDDDLKNQRKAREHYETFLELAPDDKDAAKVHEWLASMH